MGHGHLSCLRPSVPAAARLLGPQRRGAVFQRQHLFYRQPDLQRRHGLCHPGAAGAHNLEPEAVMAGQARAEWNIRPWWLVRVYCVSRYGHGYANTISVCFASVYRIVVLFYISPSDPTCLLSPCVSSVHC